jgi:hypothetical protein
MNVGGGLQSATLLGAIVPQQPPDACLESAQVGSAPPATGHRRPCANGGYDIDTGQFVSEAR